MERKDFIASASLLIGGTFISKKSFALSSKKSFIIPPYLIPGDTIGITSPSGAIKMEDLKPSIDLMQSWGFKIEIGKTIGQKDGTFGGSDEERIKDFQYMLDNPTIKTIMCARGGYGVVRIIDQIDFSHFRKNPKWIIGFSDITVFHSHIFDKLQVATIHSKMCNSFPTDWNSAEELRKDTIISIQKALTGIPMQYNAQNNIFNKYGKCEGRLIGGNLRTIENLAGTVSEMETEGAILFLEEVDEQLYNIDRMFWNLERTGKLSKLAGLIIGGFKIKPDNPGDDPFSLDLVHIVLEKVQKYNYPVCFDFPVGHQVNNYALKCGCKHQLEVKQNGTFLSEKN